MRFSEELLSKLGYRKMDPSHYWVVMVIREVLHVPGDHVVVLEEVSVVIVSSSSACLDLSM